MDGIIRCCGPLDLVAMTTSNQGDQFKLETIVGKLVTIGKFENCM